MFILKRIVSCALSMDAIDTGTGFGTGAMETPQLHVQELYKKRIAKDQARLKAYNQILGQIYHRIRVMSQLPNHPCYLMYTVPPFILGLPKIDLEDCIVYLVYQLRTAGFKVRYTFPSLLYIAWEHHEQSYILEQSPILQAMLETGQQAKERAEVKQRAGLFGGVGVGGTGRGGSGGGSGRIGRGKRSDITAPSVRGMGGPKTRDNKRVSFRNDVVVDSSAPSVGAMPSAGDYTPPVAFMQQMDKPVKQQMGALQGMSAEQLWKL